MIILNVLLESYSKYFSCIESHVSPSQSELEDLVCRKNWAEIEAIDQSLIRVLDMMDVSPD